MDQPASRTTRILLGLGFLALALVLLRTAWICDDAQITFRTVLNWCHGWGLRWNVAERVQSYTHPLWMLVLALVYKLLGELYVSTMVLSLLLTLGATRVLVARAASTGAAAVAVAALVGSKAFVEYGTSGLETPLALVLLVMLLRVADREGAESPEQVRLLVGLAALLFLVRFDLVLVAGPLLLVALPRDGERGPCLRAALLGALPALAWLAFAAVYYGTPLPNTYYAKLGAALPLSERLGTGFDYLLACARFDPLTPLLILAGVGLALRSPDRVDRATGLGAALYVAYSVWIGGDFMLGRFLAVPAFLAAMILARRLPGGDRPTLVGVVLSVGIGLLAQGPNLLAGGVHHLEHPAAATAPHLMTDERAYYYGAYGLLAEGRGPYPAIGWPSADRPLPEQGVKVWQAVGIYGVGNGPGLHIVDELALCDPLLARLPARTDWQAKPGHYHRVIPEGYLESLESGENRLADPKLREFYQVVRLVTRGPIWDGARLRAALGLFLGSYDHLIDRERYRTLPLPDLPGGLPVVRGLETRPAVSSRVPLDAPGVARFLAPGAELRLEKPARLGEAIEGALLNFHDLYLRFFLGEKPVGFVEARGKKIDGAWLEPDLFLVPRALRGKEFDRVVLQVPPGQKGGALAYLRFPETGGRAVLR